mmetsp:Transcript_29181/g.67175  ORF Transcript_29181/g.67175 Transcript_29181/m.67175 type:complete len:379 (-) Transcript_29181:120-1256(-)
MTGPRRHRGHHHSGSAQLASYGSEGSKGEADMSSKGPISMLQEFIQCSRDFPAPPNRPILQWSFDTRMADFTTLEFRGIVAFLLDGVPHHVAGTWQRAKKLAQRDAAERALEFFVHQWGEHLLPQGKGRALPTSHGVKLTDSLYDFEVALDASAASNDIALLEAFCSNHPCTGGASPVWTVKWDNGYCHASVEAVVLGVVHHFEGSPAPSEMAAKLDTAQKVLWYLHCPGFESSFEVDTKALCSAKDYPTPPPNWAGAADDEDAVRVAEQKTVLMRTQNRLQQVFAKELRPGQSVWEWSYDSELLNEGALPSCRATARLLVTGEDFVGNWSRGQREAQIDVCEQIAAALDHNSCCPAATRTYSGGSSSDSLGRYRPRN